MIIEINEFQMQMHWIFAHLIGDYILQNDWMANSKKNDWKACVVHVATYMIPFIFCGFNWWQFALIATQHYAIDSTQFVVWFMKAKGSGKFAEAPMSPWSIVLTDNILHILWIALVASL